MARKTFNTKEFKLRVDAEDENWIRAYWRPAMAWQYFLVCLFDFIIFPSIALYLAKYAVDADNVWKWDPITLKEGGFYHIAMGVILGVSAWTRGEENLLKTKMIGQAVLSNAQTSSETIDDDVYIDEGLDPPAHPTKRRGE